jgi:hypothetical protein
VALTRDEIFAADDKGLVKIAVPEWGGDVWLRVMTVGELDAYTNEAKKKGDGIFDDFRTRYLVKCLVDESGVRLFNNGDVEKLATKSAKVMNRLWEEALKHNSISDDNVEEEAKN